MIDLVAIGVMSPMIDSRCSLENELIESICKNPWMILYVTNN